MALNRARVPVVRRTLRVRASWLHPGTVSTAPDSPDRPSGGDATPATSTTADLAKEYSFRDTSSSAN
jgi:hypothetical protein